MIGVVMMGKKKESSSRKETVAYLKKVGKEAKKNGVKLVGVKIK